jgi:hypothetical protein
MLKGYLNHILIERQEPVEINASSHGHLLSYCRGHEAC